MKEVTILITDEDFEAMMRHHAANRPGKPLVAAHMVVAVEGDKDYNLNEFEVRDEEAAAKVRSEESFIADLQDKGVLSVVLPNRTRVLAKAPGVALHYANNSQAYKKAIELRAKGVNAFVIGQGKPAKYVRILPGNPGPEYAF